MDRLTNHPRCPFPYGSMLAAHWHLARIFKRWSDDLVRAFAPLLELSEKYALRAAPPTSLRRRAGRRPMRRHRG